MSFEGKIDGVSFAVNTQSIVAQLDSILAQYSVVDSEKDPRARDIQALTTRCIAAVDRGAPEDSAYTRAVEEVTDTEWADSFILEHLIGVVRALREDYVGGYMQRVEELIHAGVFDDFLDMANELLTKGYKDPAAVLGGSVLEEHMRKLASRAGVATSSEGKPSKADRVNADLVKGGVYNVLEQKGVTTWLDLRNKAAHGHYHDYDAAHVDLMLQGVRGFIARHPA